jgi:hypothetical protein
MHLWYKDNSWASCFQILHRLDSWFYIHIHKPELQESDFSFVKRHRFHERDFYFTDFIALYLSHGSETWTVWHKKEWIL